MTGGGLRAPARVLTAAASPHAPSLAGSVVGNAGAGRFGWSKLSAEVAEQLVSAEPEAEEEVYVLGVVEVECFGELLGQRRSD